MHKKEHQDILDNMSAKEKIQRTTAISLNKRGVIVKKFQYRVLAENEMPHVEYPAEKQLVLYARYTQVPLDARIEYGRILDKYQNAKVWRNAKKDMSVPGRLHFHFLLS